MAYNDQHSTTNNLASTDVFVTRKVTKYPYFKEIDGEVPYTRYSDSIVTHNSLTDGHLVWSYDSDP